LELKEKKNGLKKEQGELVSSDTEDGKWERKEMFKIQIVHLSISYLTVQKPFPQWKTYMPFPC
jgi:squalene cyclase